MGIDLGVVGIVSSAIKLSWSVYEKGFTKEKSSPQRYIEFGDALHGLHSNLNNIQTIVKAATTELQNGSISTFGPPSYDLTSLTEIIGNFQLTLKDCRDFLNDESKFRQRDGFITNILYNINVDELVVRLTERLAFHSTKIGLVLDPFNIHVQTQLRSLNIEQHQDTAELLQELKQLLLSSREPSTEIIPSPIERDVTVPSALIEKFADELRERAVMKGADRDKDDIQSSLTVKDGLEAFFSHFNAISRVTDSISYLRLMKSIWIMDKMRESKDWVNIQRTNPGGLYDRCVREMDRRLRTECSRVAESRWLCPPLSMILQLPEEVLLVWSKAPSVNILPPASHLGVLFDVPVLPDLKSHTLRVVHNIDGTLGVEDTTVATSRSSGMCSRNSVIQKLNIDLSRAYLVPIYAMPSDITDAQPALSVKVQSSRDGINGVTPEFKSMSDLLRLQHLITGYRCVKHRKAIKIKSLTRGQDFPHIQARGKSWTRKPSSALIEVGNLQLWQKTPYEKSQSTSDSDQATERRPSGTSSPYPRSSTTSRSTPSVYSTMSSAHTQQISLGSSRTALELRQPEPPLLVLFLQQPGSGQLSFLAIELDERTKIEPNSCDCRSTKKNCAISVLERSGTPLLARRFYARGGLNSWNLAAIGEHWSTINADAVRVRDMYWLRIGSKSEDERIKFNSNVADLVRIYAGRLDDYRRDLALVRGTHIITQKA